MSELNFNLTQPSELRNVIYWNAKNGYKAILNGNSIGIQSMETVKGLAEIIPVVKVDEKDWDAVEKAFINK